MRHDPWRRDPAAYPLRGELMPRYTDVDVWQHMNNTALASLHGEAVQRALRGTFGENAWRNDQPVLCTSSSATDFLLEAHYPAPLAWGARLTGVDDAGLQVATALFQHDTCVGQHQVTLAGWADGAMAGLSPAHIDALRAAKVPGADALTPMRPPAAQEHVAPAPEHFPWRTDVSVRFSDSDARRLASDTFLVRCAEQLRVAFLDEVFGSQRSLLGGMLVAHVSVRWLRRQAPGRRWELGCGVAHIGAKSMAVRGAMFDGAVCVATCEAVMVTIDTVTRRSAPLSDGQRAVMEPYRMHLPDKMA